MADYDLGTAHGRIVVDYDGKATKEAEKDIRTLGERAQDLLGRFGNLAKDWREHGKSMQQTAVNVAKTVGLITGVAVAAHTAMRGFGASFGLLREAHGLVGDLGTAMGALPEEMDNWPVAIRRVIQLNAGVSVLTGTLGLLARATAGVRGVSVVTGLLGRFGDRINLLAAPLRLVSSLAFNFITIIKTFSFIKSAIGTVLKLHGAIALLGGSVHIISGLVSSIKDLSKSALLLPAILGSGALAMGTFKIATLGMGDALKAIGDPAKFAEAIKDMSPAAQGFAKAIQSLNPQLKELKNNVQEKFFAGLGPIFQRLGGIYLPMVSQSMGRVATSFNLAIREIAAFFDEFEGRREVANDFQEGLNFSAQAVSNLTSAAGPLVEALYLIWRVGTEVFAEITAGSRGAAVTFREFIGEARRTGDLKRWMLEGVQAVKDLIAIVINLGKIFNTVFQGLSGGSGQSFLGFLRQATERMLAFLKSAEGQRVLAVLGSMLQHVYENGVKMADAFVKYILPAIEAFLPFIERMSTAVGDGLVGAMVVLGPLFEALGHVLSALAPFLGPIVTALVFLTTTAIGLAVAAGILSKALLILRTGLLLVRGAAAVAGFAFRLITGGLGPAERAVLRFIGLIGRRLVGALAAAARSSRLLKFGGLAAGVGAVAVELDKFNLAAVGGDPAKLGMMEGKLHDLVEAGKLLAAGDFGTIFSQIGQQFNDMTAKWSAGEAPIQQWAVTAGTALSQIGTKIATSFNNDFLIPIQQFPGKVLSFLVNFGTTLYTSATTAWDQFKLATEQKFIELGGTVGSLPYRLGVAIGSLIGMALKWAQDTWNNFIRGSEQKAGEIEAGARALPGRILAGIAVLGARLMAKASEAWNNFKTAAAQRMATAIADVKAFPGKAGAALASLAGILLAKAVQALNSFRTGVTNGANTALAFIRSIPGRVTSAIGNLGNLLVGAGRALIDGLLAGIRRGVQAMYDFVSGIAAGIRARKGPIAKDRVLLVAEGNAIVQGLVRGMQQSLPQLWRMIRDVNTDLSGIGGTVTAGMNLTGANLTAAQAVGAMAASPVYSGPKPAGGDGSTQPASFNIERVEIPAKDVAEMKNVSDFFAAVQQKARAGKANG